MKDNISIYVKNKIECARSDWILSSKKKTYNAAVWFAADMIKDNLGIICHHNNNGDLIIDEIVDEKKFTLFLLKC